jgi:hypothetical protein
MLRGVFPGQSRCVSQTHTPKKRSFLSFGVVFWVVFSKMYPLDKTGLLRTQGVLPICNVRCFLFRAGLRVRAQLAELRPPRLPALAACLQPLRLAQQLGHSLAAAVPPDWSTRCGLPLLAFLNTFPFMFVPSPPWQIAVSRKKSAHHNGVAVCLSFIVVLVSPHVCRLAPAASSCLASILVPLSALSDQDVSVYPAPTGKTTTPCVFWGVNF